MKGVELSSELKLPCGVSLPNRFMKSALTEGLGDEYNRATKGHVNLYKKWAKSGCGLIMTGNIQIDRRYLERPGNVTIDGPQDATQRARLEAFAQAAKSAGNLCGVQLNHPGRQANTMVSNEAKAPSDIAAKALPLPMPKAIPLTTAELDDLVHKFADAALVVKEVGFDLVQIHAAHGYLCAAMLNPAVNNRTDKYGGSLENRARFLLDVVKKTRQVVGAGYPISVKLNSSDFQKGGFTPEEAQQVAIWLDEAGLDLLEISGGNYESPAMMAGKGDVKESTKKREAYFLEYAEMVKKVVKNTPVAVTGGFRSRGAMEEALASGIDVIGVGRPTILDAYCVQKLLDGTIDTLPNSDDYFKIPSFITTIAGVLRANVALLGVGSQMGIFYDFLVRMGNNEEPDPATASMLGSTFRLISHEFKTARNLKGLPKDVKGTVTRLENGAWGVKQIGLILVALMVLIRYLR